MDFAVLSADGPRAAVGLLGAWAASPSKESPVAAASAGHAKRSGGSDQDTAGVAAEEGTGEWVQNCSSAQALALAGCGCTGPCAPQGSYPSMIDSRCLASVGPSQVALDRMQAGGRILSPQPQLAASAADGRYSWPPRDEAAVPGISWLHTIGLVRTCEPAPTLPTTVSDVAEAVVESDPSLAFASASASIAAGTPLQTAGSSNSKIPPSWHLECLADAGALDASAAARTSSRGAPAAAGSVSVAVWRPRLVAALRREAIGLVVQLVSRGRARSEEYRARAVPVSKETLQGMESGEV